MGPDPTDLVSLQEGNVETEATGRCHVRAEAEIGVTQLQAKNTEDRRCHQKLEKARKGAAWALPTPGFQTSGPQNDERIQFCCKPLVLWQFVMAALGNEYNTITKNGHSLFASKFSASVMSTFIYVICV